MQCNSCGTQLPEGAAFCPTCGAGVSESGRTPYYPTAAPSPSGAPVQTPSPPSDHGSPPYGSPQQNPYEPLNPYAAPMPPPPPRRKVKIGLIIGVVVLALILASAGVFVSFRLLATNNRLGKTTAPPTITAQTNLTTTASPPPITATTTGNLETIPYPPYHGTLALNDSLRDSSNLNFGEASSGGLTCQFTKGAYHVGSTGQSTALCVAPATDFSNFVYEMQMTIIKGDSGGIFFRADFNSSKLYFFAVSTEGTYELILYTDSSHAKTLRNITLSAAIHRGLNQTNLIAVGANGNIITLYINHQQLVSVNDSTYSHGQIGLVAAPFAGSVDPTEVAFNNAKVWTLP